MYGALLISCLEKLIMMKKLYKLFVLFFNSSLVPMLNKRKGNYWLYKTGCQTGPEF
jgi:hypothetical protein